MLKSFVYVQLAPAVCVVSKISTKIKEFCFLFWAGAQFSSLSQAQNTLVTALVHET